VAVHENGKARIIASAEGFLATPSVVGYTKHGACLIGQIAKRHALINDTNTIHSVKRFIGRQYDEVAQEASQVSYQVLQASNGGVIIDCPNVGTQFTPEEIYAKLLRKLADAASAYLGEDVTQAVLTVPSYFTDAQRQATKEVGKLGGLEVLRIINESTAACLAHGLDKQSNETILVFDLSAASLNISILEEGDGVFEILATSNDFHLGGDDFDKKIVDWLADEFQRQENIDLRQDKQALQWLTEAAEKAKIELSSLTKTEINLPFITTTQDGHKHLDTILTRTEFEEMCSDLLERFRIPIKQALQEAKITIADINRVVLVGGSTHIPAIRELVCQITGIEPIQGVNPEEAVALGAAIQASVVSSEVRYCNSSFISWSVTSLSLGVETQGGLMTRLIERETLLPIRQSQIFSTEVDGQTSVEINILQGERVFTKDNKSLGILRLDGILPAPKGTPQIEVTFNIDGNGILSVRARDLATGKEASLVLPSALIIDAEEVEKMKNDAERNYNQDSKFLELIKAREQVISVVCDAKKQLTELVEKVSDDEKVWVEELVRNLQEVIEKQGGCNRLLSLPHKPQPAMMPVASPIYALAGTPPRRAAALCASSDDLMGAGRVK
jgi:molecular chaperone DnaK